MNMDTTPLEAGLDYFIKFDKVRGHEHSVTNFQSVGLLFVGTQKFANFDCTRLPTHYNIPFSLLGPILFLYFQARVLYKITET